MSTLTEEFRALVAKEKDFNMKCEAEFDVQYPTMFLNLDFINGNNYIVITDKLFIFNYWCNILKFTISLTIFFEPN